VASALNIQRFNTFLEENMKDQDKQPEKKEEEKTGEAEKEQEILPPLDFSSLFLPFFTQALIKLGAAEDPLSQTTDENIALAKRLIDLLDLLKEKTKGNLKPEEDSLLNNGLHQLKIFYMEKAKVITL